jgi:hypothetical protein
MKISFLILNHREPTQLLRLVSTLKSQLPDSPVVIHNDRFKVDIPESLISEFPDTYLLTSDWPISWGDFSCVASEWRSMAWMTENLQFDWLILLSCQDYPIKPLASLKQFLPSVNSDALLAATPIGELESWLDRRDRHRRYLYQYRPVRQASEVGILAARRRRWLREHSGLFVDIFNYGQPYLQFYKFPDQMPWRVGTRALHTPFTREKPCWFGSHWLSLSSRAVDYVVSYVQEHPEYAHYYRATIIPEESATATLVCNAPGLRVDRRELHYVRWSDPHTGHPDTFMARDLPELLTARGYFARKFDVAKDSSVLDELDEMLANARISSR